jgi:hypothetical protein
MVFEILSPEGTVTRMLIKLADYVGMGIEGIFVIDPVIQMVPACGGFGSLRWIYSAALHRSRLRAKGRRYDVQRSLALFAVNVEVGHEA